MKKIILIVALILLVGCSPSAEVNVNTARSFQSSAPVLRERPEEQSVKLADSHSLTIEMAELEIKK